MFLLYSGLQTAYNHVVR